MTGKALLRFYLNCGRWVIIFLLLLFARDIFSGPAPLSDMQPGSADADRESLNFSAFSYQLEEKLSFEPGLKVRPEPERKPAPAPRPAGSGAAAAGVAVSKEQQMVNLINQARAEAGLLPLQVSSQLTKAARAKSKDMIDHDYFSHTSPIYGSFTDLLSRYGISYRSAAENLAMNSSGSVSAAHDMLMASPGHRANILNGSYSLVGVGIQVRSDGSHYYTQLFIGH